MLLAKLKFAVLGLVTVAVVSTSVGVLAQSDPERTSDNDRLKVVEQKLDRLLEVLGGAKRRTTSPDARPSPGLSLHESRMQPNRPRRRSRRCLR